MQLDLQKREALFRNLIDAGFDEETIDICIELISQNKICELKAILIEKRKQLLECVHLNQRRIDCLDYFIYANLKR